MDNSDGMFGNGAWFILFVLLFGFGSGGFGFGANSGALTRAEMHDGFNVNQLLNGQREIEMNQCNNTAAIISAINQNTFAQQQCCCDLKTAIHAEGEATRALITQNTIQELRDNLQAAQLQLGNVSQTQTLLNTMGMWKANPAWTCGVC